ncbi:MAG: amino acid ABC transporter substrate-binding protein [Chloroflexi bacterium]|nr:amino acid ABC transporter substrate-binding protein [Chloroflexota bacterium]
MKGLPFLSTLLSVLVAISLVACGRPATSGTGGSQGAAPQGQAGQPAGSQATQGEPIRIGAVVPLTGRYASLGNQVRPGYEIAVEDINAQGGVLVGGQRRPLELRLYDDESDPAKTVQRLETLNSSDKVVAYLGSAGSDLHAAGAAIGDKNRLPYLGIAFGLLQIHQRGLKYLFSPFPKSPDMARAGLELAASVGADKPTRYAIFVEKTDWGLEQAQYYRQEVERQGGQVVFQEEYAPGAKDLSDLILRAKSAGADALLGMPNPPDGMTIVRQMKELDWNPKYIMLIRAPDGVTWGENLGKDGDYVAHIAGWHHDFKAPGVAELNAKYQARFGRPADVLTGPAYACVQILADAIQRAGKLDGESIRNALATTDLQNTVIGPVKFNPDGTGVVITPVTQWQNGKSELVWPPEQASKPFLYPAVPFSQR